MTDLVDDSRLLDEHRDESALAGELRENSFEHHRSLEPARPGDAREENLGHSTGREVSQHLVAIEPLS